MKEIFREVAGIVIYNPQLNKFLVQDRTSISKYGEEVTFFWWWLDKGETPLQAAKRESFEELWKIFKEYIYINTFSHNIDEKSYIRHLFFVNTTDTDFNDLEGDGGIWLNFEEMKQKKFPPDVNEKMFELIELLTST